MKVYISLRYFVCALVFGLALGSCTPTKNSGADGSELPAENVGWHGKAGVPENYVTYSKNETVPLLSEENSPVLEFEVYTLDVSDENEGRLLRQVLYGGQSCQEYAENLFNKVKDDYLTANTDESQSDAPHDWFYAEMFEGGAYSTVLVSSKTLYAYLGGAHGQTEKTFFVLDAKLGTQVFLNDILRSDARALLQERINDALREKYGLESGASLKAAGFFEDVVDVSGNFFLSPDNELGFCWDNYDIAPYAMGIIEIALPYSQIEDTLNDRGRELFSSLN
jgi:hypothetical protein